MRHVQHFAIHTNGAGSALILERADNTVREGDFVLRRCESLVDHIHLVRMDRDLAGEPGFAALQGFFEEAV